MSTEEPEKLIKKYIEGTCNPEERAKIESWYNQLAATEQAQKIEPDYLKLQDEIWVSLTKNKKKTKTTWLIGIASAAAAVLLIWSTIYFSAKQDIISHKNNTNLTAKQILPGGNTAELLLADGSIIPLSKAKNGFLAKQGGVSIAKTEDGQLSYKDSETIPEGVLNFNILRTPRGGQYQIELPDGTKAWLNSASSIKFPTVFSAKERVVEISGEVYFEVAVNKSKPFHVICPAQEVVVLGTHFNVNAYQGEPFVKTSLIEGSVKVISQRHTIIIAPKQQTLLNTRTHQLTLQDADIEGVLAWKQGYFDFKNEDLKSIMRKLSRWYDIEVDFDEKLQEQRFTGSISRFSEVSKVLRMLAQTGTVHFKTEGRRIMVMP